jgi:hypothetical protein
LTKVKIWAKKGVKYGVIYVQLETHGNLGSALDYIIDKGKNLGKKGIKYGVIYAQLETHGNLGSALGTFLKTL